MSLQKLGNEQLTPYDCEIVHIMHIHSKLFGASGPSEITGEVADPCKTRKKTPDRRVLCFSALSSGLTPPPPPIKNARRAATAGHTRPPNAATDHHFVGAQLQFRGLGGSGQWKQLRSRMGMLLMMMMMTLLVSRLSPSLTLASSPAMSPRHRLIRLRILCLTVAGSQSGTVSWTQQ